jgi:glycosyltransferase involved in cell wall biosynthesis
LIDLKRKEKLKILYLLQFFVPAWRFGGVVQLAYNIAKGMAQKGHKVTVYSTDAFEPGRRIEEKRDIIDGIEVFYFKNINNYIASKYRIVQPKSLKRQLKKHLKDYDIIHILDIYSISTFWAYKQSKKWKVPLFLTTSGVLSDYSQKTKSSMKKLFNIPLKKVLVNAEAVIVQTETEKKDCQKFNIKNINLIKPGINLSEFDILPPRNTFRKKYNLKPDDVCVLFLGRIEEVKGIRLLIDAMTEIKNSKILLFIVGSENEFLNQLLKNIEDLDVRNKIIATGWVTEEEKFEAYMGADIYCLPSIYDCAPISILEACACGLPIITTTSNGLFEIAKEGAGLVINPNDSKSLREAILELASNENTRNKLGSKSREIIQEDYNWNDKLNELEQLYYSKLD